MTYDEWTKENVPEPYGTCQEVTKKMAKEFPELRRVRGHYYCWVWGQRDHWWLMDGEEIVDPTAAQFPSKGEGRYEEWEGTEPTGMCPNCGEYCYDDNYCCSAACMTDFLASLRGPL